MALITDLEQLPILAQQHRDAFEVMLYQLQDDDDLSDARIDNLANSVAEPIVKAIDCTTCGNCCRHLDVQLGEDDLERLASGIDVAIREIREKVTVQEQDDPDIVGIFTSQPCSFLDETLCTVYENRPTSCRDYPQFTPDFRWMLGWMIEGTHLCPIIYNVLLAMTQKVDALQGGEL